VIEIITTRNIFIVRGVSEYMIDSDRRPLLKSVSTDVIISNHGSILGYSQISVLSKFSYL